MKLTIEPLSVNRPIQIFLAEADDGTIDIKATDGETTGSGPACLQGVVNVSRGSLSYSAQVDSTGTEAITLRLNTGKVIPMRAVHTSLKKKFQQERMSKFEREYNW